MLLVSDILELKLEVLQVKEAAGVDSVECTNGRTDSFTRAIRDGSSRSYSSKVSPAHYKFI